MLINKYLSKVWSVNVLLCIVSLFLYQYYTPNETIDNENLFMKFFDLGVEIIKIWWVQIFFTAMLLLSLTIFLNRMERIRNNVFFSFLSFLMVPSAVIIYILLIVVLSGDILHFPNFIIDWLMPPIVYFLFTAVQFYFFRKQILNKGDREVNI
ncbi:MAG: hypothetical protein ABIP95_00600 [Pelobium sp.]